MRPKLLILLYPSRWRDRYEDEFGALLEQEPWSAHLVLDVVSGAIRARFDPYPLPIRKEIAMTARRIENGAALVAALLVLPALILLSSAAIRLIQPTAYEPAQTANAIVNWFGSLHAVWVALIIGPLVALPLGIAAMWRRLSADADLRSDVRLFVGASGRLLRHPILVLGTFASLGSLAVLVFAIDHAIAG
jgi:hypothetical protein